MLKRVLIACGSLALLAACVGPEAEGIAPTATGTGPMIRWEPTAKPLPDLPLPNNVATRVDPT
ncbi:MAG TPA: hypothetical protein PK313_16520, partial [Myxococcota bacterium]|nr:hypothetical protein [Myxococcota bacterium]